MNGVTILNELEVVQVVNGSFNQTAGFIALCITVLICAIVGFFIGKAVREEFDGIMLGTFIGLIFSMITGPMFGSTFGYPPETKTTVQYEVTIDESVSLTEFYKHYNIIEQRGDIFVVEEKE